MLVDSEVLRAFAAQVDTTAAAIAGLDVRSAAPESADGLPASSVQWAARRVGRHLGLAANDIVKDTSAMGSGVRGAGNRYEVDDAGLAGTFQQLF